MTILNRPSHGNPSILLPLWKTVRVMGPMTEKKLLQLCSPKSLNDANDLTKKTLTSWKNHGVFQVKGGNIELGNGFDALDIEDGLFRAFRSRLLDVVLDPKHNKELGQSEPDYSADFTFAACWMFGQDIFNLPGGAWGSGIQQTQSAQVGAEPYPFGNSTRWDGFKDWARFLGLGWVQRLGGTSVLNIDPTEALSPRIPKVFSDTRELTQKQFFSKISRLLPILDRGKYQTLAQENFRRPWQSLDDNQVSPALTRGIFGLKERGIISFENRADAPVAILLGKDFKPVMGDLPRNQISHIILREKP